VTRNVTFSPSVVAPTGETRKLKTAAWEGLTVTEPGEPGERLMEKSSTASQTAVEVTGANVGSPE
jgi:hypothetical protein